METNLIKPEREKFRTFYASHIHFCEGNACAAGLLDTFDRFHSIKLQQQKSNRKYNDIAEQHGDTRTQDEQLFQSHTQEELANYLMGIFSVNTIRTGLKILIKKKVITIHRNPNPKYQFDKTAHYLFHPKVFNHWMKEQNYIVSNSRNPNLQSRSYDFVASNSQHKYLRSHNSDDAIDNKAINKENNLNLIQKQHNEHSKLGSDFIKGDFSYKNNKTELQKINKDIGMVLSNEQELQLNHRLELLSKKLNIKTLEADRILNEARYCLLDKNALTNCEQNFHRKLCCIEKLIDQGKWRTPFNLVNQSTTYSKKTIDLETNQIKKIEDHITRLQQEIISDEQFMTLLQNNTEYEPTKAVIMNKNQQRHQEIESLLYKRNQLQMEMYPV